MATLNTDTGGAEINNFLDHGDQPDSISKMHFESQFCSMQNFTS
jgi:hypothetical protein